MGQNGQQLRPDEGRGLAERCCGYAGPNRCLEAGFPVETLRLTLSPSLSAPSQAKSTRSQHGLTRINADVDMRGDLLLVISELVTNAVTHGGSTAEVSASFDDGRIRLEVQRPSSSPAVRTR